MSREKLLTDNQKRQLREKYEESRRYYEKLVDETLYTLNTVIEQKGLKVHSISPRATKVKTFESFCDKINRKRIREDHFEKIDDIAGVRVICLYRSDLDVIGKLIKESFKIIREDTSRTRTDAPFGYASDHYIVALSDKCKGSRYDDIKHLPCEIQIRTILMDAWASVSHHLDYKQEIDIPAKLRRDFSALAGLFYVADTHFHLFREGVEKARSRLMRSAETGVFNLDQKTNLDSITAYAKWKFPERTALQPFGVSPSEMVKRIVQDGYENLRQLDMTIGPAVEFLRDLEKRIWGAKKMLWNSLVAVDVCLDIVDEAHFEKYNSEQAGEEVAKCIEEIRRKMKEAKDI